MNIKDAIKARHSVRQFQDRQIANDLRNELNDAIAEANLESGLHIQIIYDEPECFDSLLAHYGKFHNVKNYIAIVGNIYLSKLEESGGYYGQKLVLLAQQLGLNTCWVGGSFGKKKCKAVLENNEKLLCVIAIGYGENSGTFRKTKSLEKLCDVEEADMPVWFRNGMIAAMMAPTALNQQKFFVSIDGDDPVITTKGGMMTQIDLGIVKYNFEAASGHKCK